MIVTFLFLLVGSALISSLPQNATSLPRSLFSPSPSSEASLGFVMREIGLLECTGVDALTGGHFFENLMGPGADTSGEYLCGPTCGGDCVPNQHTGVAPASLYPFGCRCDRNRCTAEGPQVQHFGSGRFKIICVRDTRCSCDGMVIDPSVRTPHTGYLCNWINLSTHRVVSFLDRLPNRPYINPTYSPIRWCSCCPQEVYSQNPQSPNRVLPPFGSFGGSLSPNHEDLSPYGPSSNKRPFPLNY